MQNEDGNTYFYRQKRFHILKLRYEDDSNSFCGQIRFLFQHAEWRWQQLFLQARRICNFEIAEWRQQQQLLGANKTTFSAFRMKTTADISTNYRWRLKQLFLFAKKIPFSVCRMKTAADFTDKKFPSLKLQKENNSS